MYKECFNTLTNILAELEIMKETIQSAQSKTEEMYCDEAENSRCE